MKECQSKCQSSQKIHRSKLIICGCGNDEIPTAQVREDGHELWYLGVDRRDGADRYFELHGIEGRHPEATRELPAAVYEQELPINNSICALLVYAWLQGYTDIKIKGSPMIAKREYIEQRPALAYVVGFLNGRGIQVDWVDGPKNINYGRKRDDTGAKKV